jgi:hypothetical protein
MKKATAVLATWLLTAAALVLIIPGAKAAVFTGSNQFSGYSTGPA